MWRALAGLLLVPLMAAQSQAGETQSYLGWGFGQHNLDSTGVTAVDEAPADEAQTDETLSSVHLLAGFEQVPEGIFWTGAELDYSSISSLNDDAASLSMVLNWSMGPDTSVLTRLGARFGNETQGQVGLGFIYQMERNLKIRLEAVRLRELSSLQLSVSYYPGRSRFSPALPFPQASSTATTPVTNIPSKVPAPPIEAIGAPM